MRVYGFVRKMKKVYGFICDDSIVMVVVNGFVKVYDYIDYRIRVALFLTKSS
jgi:hypothetical protein